MAGWLGQRLTKWSNERDNDDYNLFGGIEKRPVFLRRSQLLSSGVCRVRASAGRSPRCTIERQS
jgi:hypothetical protein